MKIQVQVLMIKRLSWQKHQQLQERLALLKERPLFRKLQMIYQAQEIMMLLQVSIIQRDFKWDRDWKNQWTITQAQVLMIRRMIWQKHQQLLERSVLPKERPLSKRLLMTYQDQEATMPIWTWSVKTVLK